LGQSTSLEGPIAALGQGIQAGLNACFKGINAQGGLKNRKIILKSLNDSYNPAKTKENAETLIHQNKVFLLIQTMGTPNTEAILPLLQSEHVPLLAPFSGANSLREPFSKYVIHIRGSYWQEMERMVKNIVDQKKLKRVACFYQDDSFGVDGLAGLKKSLANRGVQLIGLGRLQPYRGRRTGSHRGDRPLPAGFRVHQESHGRFPHQERLFLFALGRGNACAD
jgi:ABC-type branched-subunit amino acid transport system substrate-binding protein